MRECNNRDHLLVRRYVVCVSRQMVVGPHFQRRLDENDAKPAQSSGAKSQTRKGCRWKHVRLVLEQIQQIISPGRQLGSDALLFIRLWQRFPLVFPCQAKIPWILSSIKYYFFVSLLPRGGSSMKKNSRTSAKMLRKGVTRTPQRQSLPASPATPDPIT